jgi:hypothetical protein
MRRNLGAFRPGAPVCPPSPVRKHLHSACRWQRKKNAEVKSTLKHISKQKFLILGWTNNLQVLQCVLWISQPIDIAYDASSAPIRTTCLQQHANQYQACVRWQPYKTCLRYLPEDNTPSSKVHHSASMRSTLVLK